MTRFFDLSPTACVAVNLKAGSTSIARAIIRAKLPEVEALITRPDGDGLGTAYPKGLSSDTLRWHGMVPKCDPMTKEETLLMVRDPVDRFRSAAAEAILTVPQALDALDAGQLSDPHFQPQSDFLVGRKVRLYRFPQDIPAFSKRSGLELKHLGTTSGKQELSERSIQRINDRYAKDLTLFTGITRAGQVWRASSETFPVATLKLRRGLRGLNQEELLDAWLKENPVHGRDWAEAPSFASDDPLLTALAEFLELPEWDELLEASRC